MGGRTPGHGRPSHRFRWGVLRRMAGPRRAPRRPRRLRRTGDAVGQRLLPADAARGDGRRPPGDRHHQRRVPTHDQPRPQLDQPAGSCPQTTKPHSPRRSSRRPTNHTRSPDGATPPSLTPEPTCHGPAGSTSSRRSTPSPWTAGRNALSRCVRQPPPVSSARRRLLPHRPHDPAHLRSAGWRGRTTRSWPGGAWPAVGSVPPTCSARSGRARSTSRWARTRRRSWRSSRATG